MLYQQDVYLFKKNPRFSTGIFSEIIFVDRVDMCAGFHFEHRFYNAVCKPIDPAMKIRSLFSLPAFLDDGRFSQVVYLLNYVELN